MPIRALLFFAALSVTSLTPAQEIDIESLAGKEWYGIYMNGQKAGYSTQEITVSSDGAVTMTEDAHFKLNMVGVKQDMRILTKREYRSDGSLARVESIVDDISGVTQFQATAQGDTLVLLTTVGGQRNREVFPLPAESLADMMAQIRLIREDASVGAGGSSGVSRRRVPRSLGV